MADIHADFLVIGSGIAGLSLAIKLSELGEVVVLTKRESLEGNTQYAQGGIAAVMSSEDSMEDHLRDTLRAGAGLCKEAVVRGVVKEGPQRVEELIEWGMRFTLANGTDDETGTPFSLGLEGGHSHRRVLHAGDATGSMIAKALFAHAKQQKRIRFLEWHIAIDLISTEKVGLPAPNRCLGAYVLDVKTGQVHTALGRHATLLATGGAGKVYLYTSNPDIATGDGMAMAYRAGAALANMEFVQFHPTCLFHPQAKSFLISEAVRGEGGILKRKDGTAFMAAYHPMKDLAPRDIVARAIDTELKASGDPCVYLDIRHKGETFLRERFPTIYDQCRRFGIDMAKDVVPVVPAAHYFCGGVQTDEQGKTSLDGLWAIGETACTGLHGANRLASNSLLEGLVFAHRAFRALSSPRQSVSRGPASLKDTGSPLTTAGMTAEKVPPWNPGAARNPDEQVIITQNWDEIRQMMWNYVGIVRSNKRLERAWRRIQLLQQEIQEYYWDFLITPDLIELRNIATVAELVIQSAMQRKESRGLHYNLDYPETDQKNVPRDTVISKETASLS